MSYLQKKKQLTKQQSHSARSFVIWLQTDGETCFLISALPEWLAPWTVTHNPDCVDIVIKCCCNVLKQGFIEWSGCRRKLKTRNIFPVGLRSLSLIETHIKYQRLRHYSQALITSMISCESNVPVCSLSTSIRGWYLKESLCEHGCCIWSPLHW